jgi:hypothetical protein
MIKKIIIIIILLFSVEAGLSQEVKVKPDRAYYPGGQIGVLTDLDAVYLNFGGPGFRIKANKFSVSYNMLPSLRFSNERIIPTLGTGVQFFYDKYILMVPFYYVDQRWRFAAGLGYRIGN